MALAFKGVTYESRPVNLSQGGQKEEAFRSISPTGYIPCLLIDGRPIVESVAIVELLDDLYPTPPLYPTDPFLRASVRSFVEAINSGIQPLQNLVVLERVSQEDEGKKAWAAYFNTIGLARLETFLERNESAGMGGPYAFGDVLTAADIFLVPQVYSARRFGVDLAPYARVRRVFEHVAKSEVAQVAWPEQQPDAPR